MLSYYISELSKVDTQWLKQESYPMPEPFVPELFGNLQGTTTKYEKLQQNKLLSVIAKENKR